MYRNVFHHQEYVSVEEVLTLTPCTADFDKLIIECIKNFPPRVASNLDLQFLDWRPARAECAVFLTRLIASKRLS